MRCPRGTTLRSDTRGITAIEFAMLAPCLLLALGFVLELGWQMATGAALDYGAREASRFAITGSCVTATGVTSNSANRDAEIRTLVTEATAGFLNPDRLTLTATSYTSFSAYQKGSGGGTNYGVGGNTVTYVVTYRQPLLASQLIGASGTTSLTHSVIILVQNDPFPATCS